MENEEKEKEVRSAVFRYASYKDNSVHCEEIRKDKWVCMSLKHCDICEEQRLQIVSKVYRDFKNKRQKRVLPFYRELIRFQREHGIITNRQFFYHLVEQPLGSPLRIDVSTTNKSNSAISRVKDLTVNCRLGGLIPIDSIADDTATLGTEQTNSSIEEFLKDEAYNYRSDWFEQQDKYVEVWLEKNTLRRIFYPITDNYGVYLCVSGKYPSLAQINSSKKRFLKLDKDEFVILYFGDLDNVGKDMCRYMRKEFEELRCENVEVKEIAINVNQVEDYGLSTIPLKKHTTVKWYKRNYGVNYGCEIDALPPDILRAIIKSSIESVLDMEETERKREEDESTIDKILLRLTKLEEED